MVKYRPTSTGRIEDAIKLRTVWLNCRPSEIPGLDGSGIERLETGRVCVLRVVCVRCRTGQCVQM